MLNANDANEGISPWNVCLFLKDCCSTLVKLLEVQFHCFRTFHVIINFLRTTWLALLCCLAHFYSESCPVEASCVY